MIGLWCSLLLTLMRVILQLYSPRYKFLAEFCISWLDKWYSILNWTLKYKLIMYKFHFITLLKFMLNLICIGSRTWSSKGVCCLIMLFEKKKTNSFQMLQLVIHQLCLVLLCPIFHCSCMYTDCTCTAIMWLNFGKSLHLTSKIHRKI